MKRTATVKLKVTRRERTNGRSRPRRDVMSLVAGQTSHQRVGSHCRPWTLAAPKELPVQCRLFTKDWNICKKPTSRGDPRRSSVQVLTAPDAANFGDRTRTGGLSVVWTLAAVGVKDRIRRSVRRSSVQVLTAPDAANFGDRTRTGGLSVVWTLAAVGLKDRIRRSV
ncbi:hypothetical protein EVAR_54389_1 [Eumeta japonica]|uniref:Uncharacterized protein n=1 Tax=Eumeta variegata TaxID=151549 RepID=A0A4C1Y7N5_EUMVA|nr:hypothetical protein EVAR_54389_1 [Eumeta japonica]